MIEKHNGLNLIRISKSKIKDTAIVRCIGNGETLEQMYNRLPDPKPDILINGGFFNFADRWTTAALKINNQIIRSKSAVNYGYALCLNKEKINLLTLGNKTFEETVKDFPNAIEISPLIIPTLIGNQLDSGIVNGSHLRTAIGFDEKNGDFHIYVTDNKYTYKDLAIEMKKYGTTVSAGLDGGGSSLVLFQGNRVNNQPERRPIANAIAIWLHEDTKEDPKLTIPEQKPIETPSNKVNPKDIIIAIDNGHGINTPGKRTPIFPKGHKYEGKFMHEWEFNYATAKYLGKHLENTGFNILYVSDTSEDTPLKTRTDLANNTIKNKYNKPANFLVSIHANAMTGEWGTANGIETYIYAKGGQAEKYANLIHKHLIADTRRLDRKVKVGNLHMVRETKMPAVLVECGFMDFLPEAELLMSDEYRKICALAIAKGICEYHGIELKPYQETKTNPPSNKIYKVQVGAFTIKENAEKLKKELEGKGYQPIIVEVEK